MVMDTVILSGVNRELLNTELLFSVTSAKLRDVSLIKLNMKPETDERKGTRRENSTVFLLKKMKREKKIQLFISSDNLDTSSVEGDYLLNVHPELSSELDGSKFYIVKL
jgi:hypothetical protein